MSQPNMMNQNLPNGVPPQFNAMQRIASQDKTVTPFNGLDSSHSSRDSSPLQRYHQIPQAQLPPTRTGIPASQLPPSRSHVSSSIGQVTQGLAHLSVLGGGGLNEATPFSSPVVATSFSTSTPVLAPTKNEPSVDQNKLNPSGGGSFKTSVLSPISTESKQQLVATSQGAFTHSATSQFTNVVRQTQGVADGSNHSNNLNRAEETVTNRNTLTEAKSEPVQGKQQSSSNNWQSSQPDNTSHKQFDANIFTSRQNLGIEQTPGRSIQQQVNLPQQGHAQQTSASSTQINQQRPVGQYHQQVSQFPFNTSNLANANSQQSYQNHPPTLVNQVPAGITTANPNFGQRPYGQSYQNVQPTPPINQAGSSFGQKPAALPDLSTATNQGVLRQQQHVGPPVSQVNSGHMLRPKMHSSLSQPRLNAASMPPSPYGQNVQYSQMSQEFGSMPNLAKTDALAGPPQNGNFANLPNIPPPTLQNMAQARPNIHGSRYPQTQSIPGNAMSQHVQPLQGSQTYQQGYYQNQSQPQAQLQNYGKNLSVTQAGFSKLWGHESHDLLHAPNILPSTKVEAPKLSLGQDFLDAVNCNPDIFRCTMTKIPETSALLQKSRLPLGVLIHPFRDLNHLPVIQCNTIVRCRACRTYINPFVFFVDAKRWKCNLCYRVNELPEEFQYDPVSKTYGDPSRRPEIKSSTIEYIAPAEYMLRPPQPAVYLFLLDVSRLAVETGYLHTVCNVLSGELSNLPGDARTHIGFLAYDSALHFYSLSEGQSQPHEMTVLDIEDVFLPCPDNLLVNLQDRMELVSDLLSQLPTRYNNNFDTGSALGAALQVAYKMMAGTGGRVTVFQAVLPTLGPGSLTAREDPSQRASTDTPHLNPANDFYKRLALECSGQQVAVDLFVINSQYIDLATISGISRFSGGCMYHFPLFKASRSLQNDSLEKCFRRYVTRKIGFEAVMRIRCTRGLSIHTFHGNFFVRSTDLLSLPNINPDAGFGMQVAIEENLSDVQTICFQAALLYTSSKGERRIRVHTMCLPVANNLTDVINSADQQCIIGLLSKMAVDRSMQSSLSDAREAFLNVAIDILSSYKLSLNMGSKSTDLLAPDCLKLLPLYISALLKSTAFRIGVSTRLDDRVKAMCDMKTKPLPYLIQQIYPDLYPIHNLEEQGVVLNDEEEQVHLPPRLQLTARNIDLMGAYLLDTGEHMVVLVCSDVSSVFLSQVLGVADFGSIGDEMYELPLLDNPHNQRLHMFIGYLNDEKPFAATVQVLRENSPNRGVFLDRLIEDRMESSLSYHEFLQHIKTQVK